MSPTLALRGERSFSSELWLELAISFLCQYKWPFKSASSKDAHTCLPALSLTIASLSVQAGGALHVDRQVAFPKADNLPLAAALAVPPVSLRRYDGSREGPAGVASFLPAQLHRVRRRPQVAALQGPGRLIEAGTEGGPCSAARRSASMGLQGDAYYSARPSTCLQFSLACMLHFCGERRLYRSPVSYEKVTKAIDMAHVPVKGQE